MVRAPSTSKWKLMRLIWELTTTVWPETPAVCQREWEQKRLELLDILLRNWDFISKLSCSSRWIVGSLSLTHNTQLKLPSQQFTAGWKKVQSYISFCSAIKACFANFTKNLWQESELSLSFLPHALFELTVEWVKRSLLVYEVYVCSLVCIPYVVLVSHAHGALYDSKLCFLAG